MEQLAVEKHIDYIVALNTKVRDYEFWLTEHLRLNGIYWGLTALFILDTPDSLNSKEVIKFVLSCFDKQSGGFGAFPEHDGHMLLTLSAVQILSMLDLLDVLSSDQRHALIQFIKGNQVSGGGFQGDRFGEIDVRFVYNGVSALSILGELTEDVADSAVEFILGCQNFDGGFGMVPGAESHAGQIFTCLGALAICDKLEKLSPSNQDLLASWLSERQQDSYNDPSNLEFAGGLNGRPEKLPDVCYSWWVLSSLAILDKLSWIDQEALTKFILRSQDLEKGGISDRPNNEVDVYHTVFGLAGLSLMGYPKLQQIDPVYCMPASVTRTFRKWVN